nr:histidine kinase [Lachnospiraceae bacterium]
MKFWDSLSYNKKIFAGMLIAAITPLIVYFFFVTQIFGFYNNAMLKKEALDTLKLAKDTTAVSFDDICGGLLEMSANPACLSLLKKEIEEDSPSLYRENHVLLQKYGDRADMGLYSAEGERLFFTGDGVHVREKLSLNWGVLFEAKRTPDDFIVRNANIYKGTDKESFLNIAKAVLDENGDVIGYAVASVYSADFDRVLGEIYPAEFGVLHILDDFRKPVYSSAHTASDREFLRAEGELIRDGKELIRGESDRYRYYHIYDGYTKLHYFYRQSVIEQNRLRRTLLIFAILATAVSLIICLFLSRRFSKRFYAPIERITDSISKIKDGDYSACISEDEIGGDELGSLSRNVNLMAQRLSENTDRLLERERELGNANIKMMQAQLNPHFLYNALDTLKWMGKEYGVPEVTTISSGLSGILRSSISRQQMIKLSDELTLIEDYVNIQKIRFDDKFEMLVDIEEGLKDVSVPKLILQPAVENSIVHGFEEKDNGQILISAETELLSDTAGHGGDASDGKTAGSFFIRVKDNGCGIDEETVKRMNDTGFAPMNERNYGHGSIGLHHVNAIIKLHY